MRTIGLLVKQSPKLPCPVCGREYASEAALSKHLKEKHPDYKPSGADA